MIQEFDFKGVRQINAQGSFFHYRSATAFGGNVEIKVRADGQDIGIYLPGDSIKLPVNAAQWEIIPTNPACVGKVRVGIGQIRSNSVVGQVEVIDSNSTETLEGKTFSMASQFGGTAGTYAAVGVWNPPTSKKYLVIDEVGISCAATSTVRLCRIDSVLTTTNMQIWPKRLGTTYAEDAMLTGQEMAQQLPVGFYTFYTWNNVLTQTKVFTKPVILPPGVGMVGLNQTAGQIISVNIEWTAEFV